MEQRCSRQLAERKVRQMGNLLNVEKVDNIKCVSGRGRGR